MKAQNFNRQPCPITVSWSIKKTMMLINYGPHTMQIFLTAPCAGPENYGPFDITEQYNPSLEGKQPIKNRDRLIGTYNRDLNWIIIWNKGRKYAVNLPYTAKEIHCGKNRIIVNPKITASA